MISLFNTNDIRKVDSYAIKKLGIPGIALMENASINIFNEIFFFIYPNNIIKRIGFFCGRGNNVGEGFVKRRNLLKEGFPVKEFSEGLKIKWKKVCWINNKI